MSDFLKASDPIRSSNFKCRWTETLSPSLTQKRLLSLRQQFGNVEGTQIFREEITSDKSSWM